MRASKLPLLVAFTERSTAQDSSGGQVETWVAFQTVYAGVRALSGRELEAAQARANEVTHKWEIRYLPGLLPAMRIEFGGQYFNILWIDNVEFRNRQMFVYTSTGVATG